jgi:hypothetical protein
MGYVGGLSHMGYGLWAWVWVWVSTRELTRTVLYLRSFRHRDNGYAHIQLRVIVLFSY